VVVSIFFICNSHNIDMMQSCGDLQWCIQLVSLPLLWYLDTRSCPASGPTSSFQSFLLAIESHCVLFARFQYRSSDSTIHNIPLTTATWHVLLHIHTVPYQLLGVTSIHSELLNTSNIPRRFGAIIPAIARNNISSSWISISITDSE
jgi:hypothetical protein